jgi:2-iminobutanoate/2-iminopropanoate deaminase
MSEKAIQTDKAPAPAGAYRQGVVAGGFPYTAGFDPQDPETGQVAPTVGEQTVGE